MISYEDDRSRTRIHVLLDGKKVGQIIPSAGGGYRYRTKSGGLGDVFPTVAAVKQSLEGGDGAL